MRGMNGPQAKKYIREAIVDFWDNFVYGWPLAMRAAWASQEVYL
jgi:hypothetical protein